MVENEIISEFINLLDSNPKEEQVHQFIVRYPFIIAGLGSGVKLLFSKPKLGSDFVADFALAGWGNYISWTFVEIERPEHRLFTKEGLNAQGLNRAIAQINSWWIWLYDHSEYASKEFYKLGGDYSAAIVIGRRATLSDREKRILQQLNQTQLGGRLKIVTYDTIIDLAVDNIVHLNRDYMKYKSIKEWADSEK